MNERRPSIKAEREYLLRDAVQASPEKHPHLFRMFLNMKKRNPCGKNISLMLGNISYGGLAIRGTMHSGIILLDRKELETMNEQETRFLLAHEHGHHLSWSDLEKKTEGAYNHRDLPRPLVNFLARIAGQMYADLVGVAECGSAFVAGSHLCAGDEAMRELYDNPCEPMPEKFYDDFEIAIRIQALGLLAKSEYFYDVTDLPLFSYGRKLISETEYNNRIVELLERYASGITGEQCAVLGSFLAAALFVAGCRPNDARWYEEFEELYIYGEPEQLLDFRSVEGAYDTIRKISLVIKGIRHPLKAVICGVVGEAIYRDDVEIEMGEKFTKFIEEEIGYED